MNHPEPPLLELFSRLQEAGLPLGIEEYQLALKALQNGFGIADREALARLCRTLWVKSDEEVLLFNYHFEQVMAIDALLFLDVEPASGTVSTSSEGQKVQAAKKHLRIPLRVGYVALGGAIVLVIGSGLWFWGVRKFCFDFTSPPQTQAKIDEVYHYPITVCKSTLNSKLTISAIEIPPWLKLKDRGDGTATLMGVPKSADNQLAYLWDFNGNRLATLKNQGKLSASNIVFSRDGKHFATASDRSVRLWNLKGDLLTELSHEEQVERIGFSADGQRVATVSRGVVKFWDFKGRLLKKIEGLGVVKLSPGGQFRAMSSETGLVRLLDFYGNLVVSLKPQKDFRQIYWSNTSRRLAVLSDNNYISIWDSGGTQLGAWKISGDIRAPLFSPDDRSLITTSSDSKNNEYLHTVRRWNFNGKKLSEWKWSDSSYGLFLSPDGQYSAETAEVNTIRLWDFEGKQLAELKPQKNLSRIRFNSDGRVFLTLSKGEVDRQASTIGVANQLVRVWDLKGNQLAELNPKEKIDSIQS